LAELRGEREGAPVADQKRARSARAGANAPGKHNGAAFMAYRLTARLET